MRKNTDSKQLTDATNKRAIREQRVSNKVTWALRPPEDVKNLVERAMAATGKSRQKIIFECIKEAVPIVVDRLRKEQEAASKFFDVLRPNAKGKQ